MVDTESLKENAARIAGFFVVSTALYFDLNSIRNHENSNNHHNFDIASAIGPVASILNVIGRLSDHWNNPAKQKNIKMAIPLIPLLTLQIGFATLSAMNTFKQPIALPNLISSICLLFFTGLNWEPVSDTILNHRMVCMKKNAGRIGGIVFGAMAAATSAFAIALDSKTLFFAGLTANSLASTSESLSRVFDIVYFDKEKTNLVNKAAIILFFGLVLAGAVSSGLATAKVWNQPIDLASTFFRFHMLCYMVAQYSSSHRNEEQNLLPSDPHLLEAGLASQSPRVLN